MAINRYDQEIGYDNVMDRIEELEEGEGYEVVRTRNDEVLFADDDEDACRAYISDEDYNPERVIVRPAQLDDDDAAELDQLRALKYEADAEFGESWVILREDYFSEEWAREEALETAGISRRGLDAWPLTLIDWAEAARERRDSKYSLYSFDGEAYYGRQD